MVPDSMMRSRLETAAALSWAVTLGEVVSPVQATATNENTQAITAMDMVCSHRRGIEKPMVKSSFPYDTDRPTVAGLTGVNVS